VNGDDRPFKLMRSAMLKFASQLRYVRS